MNFTNFKNQRIIYLNILEYSTKYIEHIYYFNSIDPHEKIYQYPIRQSLSIKNKFCQFYYYNKTLQKLFLLLLILLFQLHRSSSQKVHASHRYIHTDPDTRSYAFCGSQLRLLLRRWLPAISASSTAKPPLIDFP